MLVLSRTERQSVVIGDAIMVTVERIGHRDDGHRLSGATVRFGFEAPRDVSVFRNELLPKLPRATKDGGPAPRKQRIAGQVVALPDAVIQLRIQVPTKVPVVHNGTPTVGCPVEENSGRQTAVHRISCHKEDRITICNNISVAVLDLHRFVMT